ncbi:MAG: hypothetical protein DMG82_07175 [Acidobacteria bacterium]|nr:MAG: hypothetical protein DMG82_07175 [Acidobacteriota bacterium]
MTLETRSPDLLLFGTFEVDLRTRELRKQGVKVRLQELPFQILVVLLQRPGQLVGREELRSQIWPSDTFVDFDNSLNTSINKLREALGDSADSPRFIETLPRRGYRFLVPVITNEGGKAPVPGRVAVFLSRAWRIVVVALALMLAAGLTWLIRERTNRQPASANMGIRSLVVLPLANFSGDPEQDYLSDGMTEALIAQLSAIHGLRVISRTSAMQFKGTRMSVTAIGKELNVDAVIEGSVLRSGDKIRVTVQLIRASTDEHLWAATYDRELQDVLALQSDVTRGIARNIEIAVAVQGSRPVTPAVYESYLKGRFELHKGTRAGLEEAVRRFQAAIDADATFAPAYEGLAAAYDDLGTVFHGVSPGEVRPKALAAARTALELDPELAEARALLAGALQEDWHWAEAQVEYKRAIELSPSNASAHAGLADWLVCQGRTEEALASARRAQELDPLEFRGIEVGWMLFLARRYDEAIRELRTVLTTEPESSSALWFLSFALMGARQFDEAIRTLEKVASLTDRSSAVLGLLAEAYGGAGRRAEALRLLDELQRRRRRSYVPAGAFLNAYLGLGDTEEAFAWLGRAAEERSKIMEFLKVHPFFDPLRSDPRFSTFLRRANFQ